MNQAEYLKGQHDAFDKRKAANPAAKPTPEADLIKNFNQSRAVRVGALGRAEYKLGKDALARKLLEESFSVFPTRLVVVALAEITAKGGDDVKALDYLISATLWGHAPPAVHEALPLVYARTHKGSTEGLVADLDAEYNKRYPSTLHLDAYKSSANRSDRQVLAEVFTGSGCPPCVGADRAFDAALERYSRKDLMVIMYHQHIPQPDPMTNPDTVARAKYYGVTGAPTYAVDGETVPFHGASGDGAKSVYDHIQPPIESELEKPAEAGLNFHATLDGDAVKVTAAVDPMKADSPDLKVQVLLLEKLITYSGENTIRFHPMVVRAMGGKDDDGFALVPGKTATIHQDFDLDKVAAGLKAHLDDYEAKGHRGNTFKFSEKKDKIDRGNLAVVVFVQDAKTKHILQSAYIDLNPQTPHANTDNPAGSK
jgi:thiol-disulfide isomerase/thioredoxin